MRFYRELKSESAYTIIEMLIVVVLASFLSMGAYRLYTSMSGSAKKFDSLITGELENVTAERQLLNDFKRGFPSFNTIEINDKDGKGFFDLFFDTPSEAISAADRTRTFILGTDADQGHQRDIILLISIEKPALYDPVRAYQVTPPSVFGQAGSLAFRGINHNNYVNRSPGGVHPGLWQKGALFYMYSPVSVRPSSAIGTVDFSIPAKWTIFLGRVNNAFKLVKEPLNLNGSATVRDTHPTNPSYSIPDADTFLRSLPPSGGGTPHLFMMPVVAIRYTIQQGTRANGETYNRLMRRIYIRGAFQLRGQEIAREFDHVVFSRSSVTIPSVAVEIVR